MPVVGPASEYLRAKTCLLLASSTVSTSPEHESAGAARAPRVEFFDKGVPLPAERARAVAAAMRMPVKVPGPTPASTSRPFSRARATVVTGVEASRARISKAPDALRQALRA